MKIGQERARATKLKPGTDEYIRLALRGWRFDGPYNRGAYRDNTLRGVHRVNRGLRNRESLVMELRIVDRLLMQGLKGAEPDMQSYLCCRGSGRFASLQHFRCEMQPCCRRSHRSSLPSEYSLVTFAIGFRIRPADVRRQRHMSD